jgi:sulfotransferase
MKKFHYISGLPRSGTTLLSAILNQNPRFNASISGPLARMVRAVVNEASGAGGYGVQCPSDKRKHIVTNMMQSYYYDSDKEIMFDTNRGWTLLLPMLKDMDINSKVIVCVRDISWILDSFESLIQKNNYNNTTMFSESENVNCYTRARALMDSGRTVGFAYNALKQALSSNERGMLKVVEYENLAKNPEKVMRDIYDFLGEEYFEHDFNDVEYSNDEFDAEVGIKGLHTTRKKVEFKPRRSILPPDLFNMYKDANVWRKL